MESLMEWTPTDDNMDWTSTRAEQTYLPAITHLPAVTPRPATTPHLPPSPLGQETPLPVSPSQERLRRQNERALLPLNASCHESPYVRRRQLKEQILAIKQVQGQNQQKPAPTSASSGLSLFRPSTTPLVTSRPTFRVRDDTPYHQPYRHIDEELDEIFPAPRVVVPPRHLGGVTRGALQSRRPLHFNRPTRRTDGEVPPLFGPSEGGARAQSAGAEETSPLPAQAADSPPATTSPLKRKREEEQQEAAVGVSAPLAEERPRLFKRVCRYLFEKVFGNDFEYVPTAPSPATRRRLQLVPGAWPVTPCPGRVQGVDTRPPIPFSLTPVRPSVVQAVAAAEEHIVPVLATEPAAINVAPEVVAPAEPPTPPTASPVPSLVASSPSVPSQASPPGISGLYEDYIQIDNPGLYGDPRTGIRPKFKCAARLEAEQRAREAEEAKVEAAKLEAARAAEVEAKAIIPPPQEAVNEEMSFLDDAPAARPVRRVRILESAWFDKPYPLKTKFFYKDEIINHPIWPEGEPDELFKDVHSVALPPSPSEFGTPATLMKPLPEFQLSPVVPTSGETPANLRDLGIRFEKFEVSSALRKRRDQAAREKEAAAKAAAEQLQREIEAKRKADEAQRQAEEAARLKAEEIERQAIEATRRKQKIVKKLSDHQKGVVLAAMSIKNRTSEMSKSGITRKDFGTLLPQPGLDDPKGWLNDEVVNSFLGKMVQRSLEKQGYNRAADEVPKYHAFNTNFYNNMKEKGWQSVSRWPNRAKIGGTRMLECEQILIPINSGLHWTLMCVSGTNKTISYYDSMAGDQAAHPKHISIARAYLAGSLGNAYKAEEWTVIDTTSVQQANALDCGVFVCMNSLALISGKEPLDAFSAHDMPDARQQIAATLLHGAFNDDFDF